MPRLRNRLAHELVARLRDRGLSLVTAESLTGGMIGSEITSVPGSSAVYWGGFVTYMVDAKVRLLGVEPSVIERHGVVSAETAKAMALGALEKSQADISIAVTGVAGPGGGTEAIPVGTAWIASARRSGSSSGASAEAVAIKVRARGGRERVRRGTVRAALDLVVRELDRL